jgi:hypothetical protein
MLKAQFNSQMFYEIIFFFKFRVLTRLSFLRPRVTNFTWRILLQLAMKFLSFYAFQKITTAFIVARYSSP